MLMYLSIQEIPKDMLLAVQVRAVLLNKKVTSEEGSHLFNHAFSSVINLSRMKFYEGRDRLIYRG